MISLDKAIIHVNNSNIIKDVIDQMTVKFTTVFTKLVTEKIIKALSLEEDSQQTIDLIYHSHSFIDGEFSL